MPAFCAPAAPVVPSRFQCVIEQMAGDREISQQFFEIISHVRGDRRHLALEHIEDLMIEEGLL